MLIAGTEPPQVVELWRWTFAAGDTRTSEPHTRGTQELLLVEEGRLRLTVGDESAVLEAGESATFAGDLPHAYAAVDGPVRFVMSVTEPRGGR